MNLVLADTFYYLALLNPTDGAHERAVAFSQSYRGAVLTTSWVLTEVGDAMSRGESNRRNFLQLLSGLKADPQTRSIPPLAAVLDDGVALFEQRLDKDWSLTDCISFAVMTQFGIRDALTGDHHFEQAGFRALLK